jgi:lipopolysaccharide biosynthesis glycosyltransferase
VRVCLNSIIYNMDDCDIYIVLLDEGDKTDKCIMSLTNRFNRVNNNRLIWKKYDPKLNFLNRDGCNTHVLSNATFLRCFISEFVKIHNTKVNVHNNKYLYMDVDAVLDKNIKSFWNFMVGDKGIAAVTDYNQPSFRKQVLNKYHTNLDIEQFNEYKDFKTFNAGVLMLDPERLVGLPEFTYKWLKKGYVSDQLILNMWCNGEYRELNKYLNYPGNRMIGNEEQDKVFIYHWIGNNKPFKEVCNNQVIWNKYKEMEF